MEFRKDLYEGWTTTSEAIDFFLDLVLELKALERQPNPPTEFFVHVQIDGESLTDEQLDKVTVTLEHLQ